MSVADTSEGIGDHDRRQAALDPARSFVVQAPAGSGKTELLVRRFLVLLSRVSRPEAVAAMTFTRKAAGEMRERIVGALREAAIVPEPGDEYRRERWHLARAVLANSERQGWDLLDDPGRLQLYTIDSLCARLAGSLPLLSRFGARPQTVEDATPLFAQAARRTVARIGAGNDLADALALVLERFEMKLASLERHLVDMLGHREQWAAAALDVRDQQAASALLKRVEQRFAAIMRRTLEVLATHLPASIAAAACEVAALTRAEQAKAGNHCLWPSLQSPDQLSARLDSIGAWRELGCLLLTRRGTIPKRVDKNVGAPAGSDAKAAYKRLLESVSAAFGDETHPFIALLAGMNDFPSSPHFSGEGREALGSFFHVLLACHAELWQVFRQQAKVDFTEVAVRAIAALGDAGAPSDLLERLDHRVEHLLVDEFQDTNVLQCELIRRLTAGWSGGDGRTLFLVGDPMQSIYGFRKAEVGLFLQAASRQRLFANVETEPLRLSVNFRADRSIIDWVNACFAQTMGECDDGEQGRVAYAPSQPRPGAEQGEPVRVLGWSAADGRSDRASADLAEAEGLAEMIALELAPAARARQGTVAVLVRSGRHARGLMAALRRRGVRYRAGGIDSLGERAVVQDLRSLARSLVHRGDRLSALALLRSPLVGVSLFDLCRLVEPDVAAVAEARAERRLAAEQAPPATDAHAQCARVDYASVTELLYDEQALGRVSEDARTRLLRARSILARARELLGRVELARIVESAWIALGGATTATDTEELDARAFFDLLADVDEAAGLDFDELDRRLEKLTASADPDPEVAVEFLTMHGAKGLEFDTVVLPGLGRRTRDRGAAMLAYETDAGTGRMTLIAVRPPRGRSDPDQAKFDLLKKRESARGRAELIRLLYVAATRARHRVLLSTRALGLDKSGDLDRPARGSLLETVWASLADEYEEASAGDGGGAAPAAFMRVRSDFSLPPPPPAVAEYLRTRRPSHSGDLAHDEAAAGSRVALLKGTVVHKWLEDVARDGMEGWDEKRLRGERTRIERMLQTEGVAADELSAAGDEVVAALIQAVTDERGRWLMSRHDDDRYEWGLTLCAGLGDDDDGLGERAELIEARIDRSFVDEQGRRWIIDYKTGQLPSGKAELADLSADNALARFLEDRQDQYSEQLRTYGRLVRELEADRPIMLALYFPEVPGGWCQWAFDD